MNDEEATKLFAAGFYRGQSVLVDWMRKGGLIADETAKQIAEFIAEDLKKWTNKEDKKDLTPSKND